MTSPEPVSQPARRRGRPPGSTVRVLQAADGVLGVHHLAFLRSWLQGLELRWAWARYMAFGHTSCDLRHIEHTRKQLLATVLRLGHQLNLTLPAERQITRALNVLSREPVVTPALVHPTLDEFVQLQGLDPGLYSEAELLEIYQEHYATPETDSSSAHVQALNQVGALLAVPPSPADPVSRWLDEALADQLRTVGVISLANLVGLINIEGHRWHRRVRRLGQVRAARIVAWLDSLQDELGVAVRDSARMPPQRQAAARASALRVVEEGPRFGIVPLDVLLVPSPLSGAQGLFRTNMPNTLGAHDDLGAVRAWLNKYRERPHTLRSYRKEVERFLLWCLHERRKPLSSIDANDCQAYRDFLQCVPPTWQNISRSPAGHPDWRPFRAQLEPGSQRLALVILQAMFEGLRDAGYLAANPMRAVMTGFNLPTAKINVDRSFTEREWAYLMEAAEAEAPSPRQERLVLLLELLVSMGLRVDELAKATLDDLRRVPIHGEADAWILIVTGKRRKQREVPMPDHVVALIQAHHRAFDALGAPPSPALVRALSRPPRWVATDDGAALAPAAPVGRLGPAGIYICLKRFFQRAALGGAEAQLDTDRLRSASTHWLRHTFGRQAAADAVPVEVIQQALGHASLATTTIYTSTERDRMVRALRTRVPRTPR